MNNIDDNNNNNDDINIKEDIEEIKNEVKRKIGRPPFIKLIKQYLKKNKNTIVYVDKFNI